MQENDLNRMTVISEQKRLSSAAFSCTSQLNCKYLGNRVENEIVQAICEAPQLLKLGIALEFRDALNKTAIQLLKNLDRSKCSVTVCPIM